MGSINGIFDYELKVRLGSMVLCFFQFIFSYLGVGKEQKESRFNKVKDFLGKNDRQKVGYKGVEGIYKEMIMMDYRI